MPSFTDAQDQAGAATSDSMLRGTRIGDNIAGPFAHELSGMVIRYKLTTGGVQQVSYGTDEITLTSQGANGDIDAPISGIYRARKIRDDVYLVHWLTADRSVHVGQVVDLKAKLVHIGALMPGRVELFDRGDIEDISSGHATPSAGMSPAPDAGAASAMAARGADVVGGPTTDELTGITLAYTYEKAGSFRITYGIGTVTFAMPPNPTAAAPALTVPARARKLHDDLYMIHWVSPNRGVHVLQLVDFMANRVSLAGLMPPGTTEDFDWAMIATMTKANK